MSSLGLSGNSGSSAGTSSSFSLQGTKEFLQSNSLVAKFAFLLLIIILFVMVLRQGVALLNWIFSPSITLGTTLDDLGTGLGVKVLYKNVGIELNGNMTTIERKNYGETCQGSNNRRRCCWLFNTLSPFKIWTKRLLIIRKE